LINKILRSFVKNKNLFKDINREINVLIRRINNHVELFVNVIDVITENKVIKFYTDFLLSIVTLNITLSKLFKDVNREINAFN
jgi:ABC-type polysaccharide/polyol phosphate export permease